MEVRGVDLAVQEAGTGVPVVWGHGLTSSMAAEAAMGLGVADLPEDRYRLTCYDARGHGASGATADPADYTYPSLAADQLASRLAELLPQAELVSAVSLREVFTWKNRVVAFLDGALQPK